MALARSLDVHLTVIEQNKLAASFIKRGDVCNRAVAGRPNRETPTVAGMRSVGCCGDFNRVRFRKLHQGKMLRDAHWECEVLILRGR